ncbi:MAG TPA: hypothetical protein VE465_06135 [Streptosporangiaceae bacterium]|nr:hypothetical protein [Streptosporangiaceae bacterium]
MYAFLALLAATVQTGIASAARTVEDMRTRRTVQKARPQTCVDLVGQLGPTRGVGPSEIQARAAAGPNGTLTAPFSGAECVWYVVRARERFWAYGPGPYGPQKVERSIKAADHASGPLAIADETGSATVDPAGAEFILGEPAFSGFDAREGGDGRLFARMSELLGEPVRIRHRRMTIGLLIEEWIVTADEELRIVGRARGLSGSGATADDGIVLGKSGRRPFLIAKRAAKPTRERTSLRIWGDR